MAARETDRPTSMGKDAGEKIRIHLAGVTKPGGLIDRYTLDAVQLFDSKTTLAIAFGHTA